MAGKYYDVRLTNGQPGDVIVCAGLPIAYGMTVRVYIWDAGLAEARSNTGLSVKEANGTEPAAWPEPEPEPEQVAMIESEPARGPGQLGDMTVVELKVLAKSLGVALPRNATKPIIIRLVSAGLEGV